MFLFGDDAMKTKLEERNNAFLEGIRLDNEPERLEQLYAAYCEYYGFFPGQLVMWKPGLKLCVYPDYGVPMVVMSQEHEREPSNAENPSSGAFRTYADVRVMFLVENTPHFYGFDSRHLMPYKKPEPAHVGAPQDAS